MIRRTAFTACALKKYSYDIEAPSETCLSGEGEVNDPSSEFFIN